MNIIGVQNYLRLDITTLSFKSSSFGFCVEPLFWENRIYVGQEYHCFIHLHASTQNSTLYHLSISSTVTKHSTNFLLLSQNMPQLASVCVCHSFTCQKW